MRAERARRDTMASKPKSSSAERLGFRFPMLATALEIATKGVQQLPPGAWWAEKKEDGHRLEVLVKHYLAEVGQEDCDVIGWSRTGLDTRESNRPLPKHLVEEFQKLPDGIYDGELVLPGGTSSDVALLENQRKLMYVLFDVLEDR